MTFFEQIKAFFIALFMPILMLFGWTGDVVVPETKADILNLYKTAVSDFNANTPSFEKSNLVTVSSTNFKVLGITDATATSEFKAFLDDGKTYVEKVDSGEANTEYLFLNNLTEGEIDTAECKLSDDMEYFNVKIVLKEEVCKGKGLDTLNKITNDYRDEAEIKAFMDANEYSADKIEIKFTEVTINAKISVDGSRILDLDISFVENVTFTKLVRDVVVNYSNAAYTAKTVISYEDIAEWAA